VGELVEGARMPGQDEASVAEVDVVQPQFADRLGSGGVDGGQGEDEPVGWRGGGGHGLTDVVALEWLEHRVVLASDADSVGRVTEDRAGLLAVP
jgi:hypothetical protein